MKWIASKSIKVTSLAIITTAALCSSPVVFAKHCKKRCYKKDQQVVFCENVCESKEAYKEVYKDVIPVTAFVPNWYAGGHLGVSRTHDNAAAGSGDSVTQIGPGWTVDLGYQFYQFYKATLAAELGYTQYHNSNETTHLINVASTEHFASYLAAVVQYPLINDFSIMGKLGVAYSYAKKVFTASGASNSASTYSPYYGVGFAYNITSKVDLDLQWARVRGNSQTGSTDLTSLGLTYHIL